MRVSDEALAALAAETMSKPGGHRLTVQTLARELLAARRALRAARLPLDRGIDEAGMSDALRQLEAALDAYDKATEET